MANKCGTIIRDGTYPDGRPKYRRRKADGYVRPPNPLRYTPVAWDATRQRRFDGPLRFRRSKIGGGSYVLLCHAHRHHDGQLCGQAARASGLCRVHEGYSRPLIEGEVQWRAQKWANPVFLNKQRKWWAKRIKSVAGLRNEQEELRERFQILLEEFDKKLKQFQAKGNGQGIQFGTDDKADMRAMQWLLESTRKLATTITAMEDVENRGEKMLGGQVTPERLAALMANLQRFLIQGLRDVNKEMRQEVVTCMRVHQKKFLPDVIPDKFAEMVLCDTRKPINDFVRKLQTAFRTGSILAEPDKQLLRPSAEKEDIVVG